MRVLTAHRAVPAALLCAGALLGLSGCSSSEDPLHSYLGKPLTALSDQELPRDTVYQNASEASGSYQAFPLGTVSSEPSKWIIVAICADADSVSKSNSVEFAVVPRADFDREERADMKNRAFDRYLACNHHRDYRA